MQSNKEGINMKRTDIKMTPFLENFLNFDLGHMNEERFINKIKDINYVDDLNLDIYYPDIQKEQYPVFLIIYGGGWASGFKTDKFVEPMLKPLEYGYACVVADYTLSLDAQFPKAVIDLKYAIDFIHKNKDKYHFDDENITVWGESAGGHLGLECCLLPNECLNINVNSKVKNMVIFYPPTNALTIDNYTSSMGKNLHEESVFGIFMGSHLHDEEYLKMASPINYVHEGMPNLWLQHGLNDQLVPYQQSLELIEKVKDFNIKFYYELKEEKVHTDPYFFSDNNVKRMIDFIEKE